MNCCQLPLDPKNQRTQFCRGRSEKDVRHLHRFLKIQMLPKSKMEGFKDISVTFPFDSFHANSLFVASQVCFLYSLSWSGISNDCQVPPAAVAMMNAEHEIN